MTTAPQIHHRTTTVRGHEVYYREAGPADAPVLLLLHGFPTSSHMFRDLIPLLAGTLGLLNSFRMLRLPDPRAARSVEGLGLG